tara:strand:- start:33 stop:530 length:498 start_codon:yes stop_codon:yes gene_type:complete
MKILKKIKEIKILIKSLEETKLLDDAINIQIIKKEISKLSRELWDLQRLDTTSLKYRCDAVSDSMGHAIADISKDNYTNIFDHNYERWIDRCTNDKLLSPLTKKLMGDYDTCLTGKFKKLSYKHNEKKIYQELDKADKIIFDEFIKIGCETLISLYNDFEKVIKN